MRPLRPVFESQSCRVSILHFKSSIVAHLEPSTDHVLAFGQVRAMLCAPLEELAWLQVGVQKSQPKRMDAMTPNFLLLTYLLYPENSALYFSFIDLAWISCPFIREKTKSRSVGDAKLEETSRS